MGLTPGDHYWAYINRDTHLMDRWAFLLQDQPRTRADRVWPGKAGSATARSCSRPPRTQVGGEARKLELADIAVFDTLPDTVFTSPDPVAAPAPAK